MILLTVDSITKHFGPEPVLGGVSFDVRPGHKIGLVGPNGTGKTTLMHILAGEEEADAGEFHLHPNARVGYLEQHSDFDPDVTVWDAARSALRHVTDLAAEAEQLAHDIAAAEDEQERQQLGLRFDHIQHELHSQDAYNIDHKIERILHGLGFDDETFRQPVIQLSGGQQNRLLLAGLLLAEPDLLLLDEPSNHLDIEATEWLENHLAAAPQAMIVVSHDRYFLDRVTNRTLELFQGTVESYPGNFSAYWRQKEERLLVQQRTWDRQQEEIARLEDFVRRNKYGQKHAQAEDRQKKLDRIEPVAPPRSIPIAGMAFPQAEGAGDIAMRIENLSKGFGKPLFSDLTFDVIRGEKWGIMGPNGSGKTTFLRVLLGMLDSDTGEVIHGANVKTAYFDQLLNSVDEQLEAVEAIRPTHKEFLEGQRRNLLARFGLRGDQAFQRVSSLSGGERNRVALARLAAQDANFLVLDEPTNHLDLWALESLERALSQFDGTVILVSHDRYFLNRVVDHLLVIEPGGGMRIVEGDYDMYQRMALLQQSEISRQRAESAAGNKTSDAGRRRRDDKTRRRRQFPYRKTEEIEAEIHEREACIEQIHAEMAQPETLRNGEKIKQLRAELEEQQEALPPLYEHWEEAIELN